MADIKACEFKKLQRYISIDNGDTWYPQDVFKAGDYISSFTSNCGEALARYRTVASDNYVCDGLAKYSLKVEQESLDRGNTWHDYVNCFESPYDDCKIYEKGELLNENSPECGGSYETKWVFLEKRDIDGYTYDVYIKQYKNLDGEWVNETPIMLQALPCSGLELESHYSCDDVYDYKLAFVVRNYSEGTVLSTIPCDSSFSITSAQTKNFTDSLDIDGMVSFTPRLVVGSGVRTIENYGFGKNAIGYSSYYDSNNDYIENPSTVAIPIDNKIIDIGVHAFDSSNIDTCHVTSTDEIDDEYAPYYLATLYSKQFGAQVAIRQYLSSRGYYYIIRDESCAWIDLPCVEHIYEYAFNNTCFLRNDTNNVGSNNDLANIVIRFGNKLEYVGYGAFSNLRVKTDIKNGNDYITTNQVFKWYNFVFTSLEPPIIESNSFPTTYCTIYVPSVSLEKYKVAFPSRYRSLIVPYYQEIYTTASGGGSNSTATPCSLTAYPTYEDANNRTNVIKSAYFSVSYGSTCAQNAGFMSGIDWYGFDTSFCLPKDTYIEKTQKEGRVEGGYVILDEVTYRSYDDGIIWNFVQREEILRSENDNISEFVDCIDINKGYVTLPRSGSTQNRPQFEMKFKPTNNSAFTTKLVANIEGTHSMEYTNNTNSHNVYSYYYNTNSANGIVSGTASTQYSEDDIILKWGTDSNKYTFITVNDVRSDLDYYLSYSCNLNGSFYVGSIDGTSNTNVRVYYLIVKDYDGRKEMEYLPVRLMNGQYTLINTSTLQIGEVHGETSGHN